MSASTRAEEPGDDRRPAVVRQRPELPDRHEAERVEDRIERQADADERGDVEEERVRHAHVAHESRRLAHEQLGTGAGSGCRRRGRVQTTLASMLDPWGERLRIISPRGGADQPRNDRERPRQLPQVVDALVDGARRARPEPRAAARRRPPPRATSPDAATERLRPTKLEPADRPDGVRVEMRQMVLERARTRRELVVGAVRLHVRRRGDEQLGPGLRERARQLGELDVEADQRRDCNAGELHDPQLPPRPEDLALAGEQLRLPVDAGRRPVAVEARDRVEEAPAAAALREPDHDRRPGTRRGLGDRRQLVAVRGPGGDVERTEVVGAEEQLREDGDVRLRMRGERLDRPLRVRARVPQHRLELGEQGEHAASLRCPAQPRGNPGVESTRPSARIVSAS